MTSAELLPHLRMYDLRDPAARQVAQRHRGAMQREQLGGFVPGLGVLRLGQRPVLDVRAAR
jgi:hypothetical protein